MLKRAANFFRGKKSTGTEDIDGEQVVMFDLKACEKYSRPDFVEGLTQKQDLNEANVRPIRSSFKELIGEAGYAEARNANYKSRVNEDQADSGIIRIRLTANPSKSNDSTKQKVSNKNSNRSSVEVSTEVGQKKESQSKDTENHANDFDNVDDLLTEMTSNQNDQNERYLKIPYFAVFDGHGGPNAALAARLFFKNHVLRSLYYAVNELNNLMANNTYDLLEERDFHIEEVENLIKGSTETEEPFVESSKDSQSIQQTNNLEGIKAKISMLNACVEPSNITLPSNFDSSKIVLSGTYTYCINRLQRFVTERPGMDRRPSKPHNNHKDTNSHNLSLSNDIENEFISAKVLEIFRDNLIDTDVKYTNKVPLEKVLFRVVKSFDHKYQQQMENDDDDSDELPTREQLEQQPDDDIRERTLSERLKFKRFKSIEYHSLDGVKTNGYAASDPGCYGDFHSLVSESNNNEDDTDDDDEDDEIDNLEEEEKAILPYLKPTAKLDSFLLLKLKEHYEKSDQKWSIFRDLIIGALETAFDSFEKELHKNYKLLGDVGGSCVNFVCIVNGQLFVSNLGDCRTLLIDAVNGNAIKLNTDHRPIFEKERILRSVENDSSVLKGFYHDVIFPTERPKKPGMFLCMAPRHQGLVYKKVTEEDVPKLPLIEKSRLLGQLAVSRSIGDYTCMAPFTNVLLKPFLSHLPDTTCVFLNWYKETYISSEAEDISMFDEASKNDEGIESVIVIASDGLWDVMSSSIVNKIARMCMKIGHLKGYRNRHKFNFVAQMLIEFAMRHYFNIKLDDGSSLTKFQVSGDDITVFVVPLAYKYWSGICGFDKEKTFIS